jgi:hypothetical protein
MAGRSFTARAICGFRVPLGTASRVPLDLPACQRPSCIDSSLMQRRPLNRVKGGRFFEGRLATKKLRRPWVSPGGAGNGTRLRDPRRAIVVHRLSLPAGEEWAAEDLDWPHIPVGERWLHM